MSRYQPYPSYKPSGVQWFGDIPNNWQVLRNKMLFEQTKEVVGSRSDEYTLLSLSKKGVIVRDLENAQGKFPAEFDTYQIVKPNDLVFCLFDIDETPRTVGLSSNTGMITGAYAVFKSKANIDPGYVHYYYLHIDSFKGLKPFYSGLRKTIRPDAFLNIEMPCPSAKEQTAIANFLDRETAKIDTLIEKQLRLIELLKEKRQAVISHAVTRGLDPNVKMKDSGVEWLGEVPEHWIVSILGYVSSINSGSTPDRTNQKYWNGNIPWVKTGEVNYSDIKETEEYITDQGLQNSSLKLADEGTLLMAMYGQGVTRGRVSILHIKATYNQACAAITFNQKLFNVYGKYFFIAAYSYIRDFGNETSQMNLNTSIIEKMKILIPPLHEQKDIVQYLDTQTAKIDTLIAKARQAIELMKERRTALISAAVTGKIDVRGMV